jgi:hypothetical protein
MLALESLVFEVKTDSLKDAVDDIGKLQKARGINALISRYMLRCMD